MDGCRHRLSRSHRPTIGGATYRGRICRLRGDRETASRRGALIPSPPVQYTEEGQTTVTDDGQAIDPTIRAVSDDLILELGELLALEELKRATSVDDPAFPQLARDVEDAARSLLTRASKQASLAEDTHDASVGRGASPTIEDLSPDLSPTEILAMWRDADRERALVDRGTTRWLELTARVEALRRAYQRSYDRSG